MDTTTIVLLVALGLLLRLLHGPPPQSPESGGLSTVRTPLALSLVLVAVAATPAVRLAARSRSCRSSTSHNRSARGRCGRLAARVHAKVRHLSSAARPANPTAATTLEGRDPELAADLLHVQVSPSAEWHRWLAGCTASAGCSTPPIGTSTRARSCSRGTRRPMKGWRGSGGTGDCPSSRSATRIGHVSTRRSPRSCTTPTGRSCRRSGAPPTPSRLRAGAAAR